MSNTILLDAIADGHYNVLLRTIMAMDESQIANLMGDADDPEYIKSAIALMRQAINMMNHQGMSDEQIDIYIDTLVRSDPDLELKIVRAMSDVINNEKEE
jgi:hypothetical protein